MTFFVVFSNVYTVFFFKFLFLQHTIEFLLNNYLIEMYYTLLFGGVVHIRFDFLNFV
jgi:hypothetical protein